MFQMELMMLRAGEGLAGEVFMENFNSFINSYFSRS